MADKKEALKAIDGIKPKIDELNKVINDLENQRKEYQAFIRDNKDSYDLEVLDKVKEHENRLNQVDGAIERAEAERESLKESNYEVVSPAIKEIIVADKHSQDKEYKELEKQIEKVIALHDKIRERESKLVEEVRSIARDLHPYLTNKDYESVQNYQVNSIIPLRITRAPEELNYWVERIVELARSHKKV